MCHYRTVIGIVNSIRHAPPKKHMRSTCSLSLRTQCEASFGESFSMLMLRVLYHRQFSIHFDGCFGFVATQIFIQLHRMGMFFFFGSFLLVIFIKDQPNHYGRIQCCNV